MKDHYFCLLTVALGAAVLPAQRTQVSERVPKVVSLEPPHESVEVDAKNTTELVVKFDLPMRRRSHSFCGGGPKFPKVKSIKWKDARTVVMSVKLKPDHSYAMSLNCPAARNFVSSAGVRLAPTRWQFTTLPAKLLSPEKQQALNAAAFKQAQGVLASQYSYFEHRKLDWPAVYKSHEESVLGARTTKAWARAVGRMLAPTNDLHLYLRFRGDTVATGRRAVDSLYRPRLLGKYLGGVSQPIKGVVSGRTDDGIHYLMISSWTKRIDFDKVVELLEQLRAAAAKTKGLIIDVRPNSGGSEDLARRVAEWFISGQHVYAKHAVRKGKGRKNFRPVYSRRIQGNPKTQRLSCPVAVLMSRYCMSSCEAFLLMMKQATNAKLIGQRSYGSSGNPRRHELSNGVTLVVPSWKAMRVDGTCFEGEGIRPDVEVRTSAEVLKTRDPILERALAHLRAK